MYINGIEINKVLIVAKPWVDYLVDGKKVWEMRSTNTKIRGWVGVVEKGTGTVVGILYVHDTKVNLSKSELISNFDKHCVDYEEKPELIKWNNAWMVKDAVRISPVPYEHKKGAVIWVNV